MDAFRFFRAVVKGDGRNEGVVQAEHRHKGKALKLVVYAENSHGGGGKAVKNDVHAEGHDGCNRGHDDGGNADSAHLADHCAVRPEAFEADRELRVFLHTEIKPRQRPKNLPSDSGPGGACNAKSGKAQQSKDENGVKHDIEYGPAELGDHRVFRPAGGLKKTLEADFGKKAERENENDAQVFNAILHDFFHIGLSAHVELYRAETQNQENEITDGLKKQAVPGGDICPLAVPGAKGPGHQGVDAHPETHGERDEQVLHREGHGYRRERVFTDAGYKNTVHHVIKGLHQHGYHYGNAHVQQQPFDRHYAHYIFLKSFVHNKLSFQGGI